MQIQANTVFRVLSLYVSAIYLPTILMALFVLQGVGEMHLAAILFFIILIFFHPISLILIFVSTIAKFKIKTLHFISVFVGINLILLIIESVLIAGSAFSGDFRLPLLFTIPSLLYLSYYFVLLKVRKIHGETS